MAGRVRVRVAVLDAMLAQARAEWPGECCGLLAGAQGVISEILPTPNQLKSETEYLIPPQELIAALRSIRERGLAHLGIYHSHPHSENIPSRRDIQESGYPPCVYFIVSPHAETRAIRAFRIRNGQVTEVEIEAVERADVFSSPSE
jgi:proteasome lid subunit RPN8/RPN11